MGLEIVEPNTCFRGCCTSNSIPLNLPPSSYKLLSPIARGAESVVYEAVLDGKKVAVKKPILSTSEDLDKFHKELQLLCKLDHPGIARFVAAHAKPPNYMFFFEFYESSNLAHKLHVEEWTPDIDQALIITAQLERPIYLRIFMENPNWKSYRDVLCSPAPTKTESILGENRFLDAVCEVEVEAIAPVQLVPPSPMEPDENQLSDALCEEVEAVAPVSLASRRRIHRERIKRVMDRYDKLEFDPKEYAEFLRQFRMSDGFDLDFVPKKCVGCPAIFNDMDELDKVVHREATYCAKFAISSHNEQHEEEKSKLDFVELVKLNLEYSCGTTYYLTLKAKNGDGVVSVYQAKVYYEEDKETKILIFREKPSSYPEIKRVEKKHGCTGDCAKKVLKRERDIGCACSGINC